MGRCLVAVESTSRVITSRLVKAPDTVLVLGRGTSIFRSTNGGVTFWNAIGVSSLMNDIDFNKDRSVGIAIGFHGEIIVTTDGGITWETQKSPTTYFLYDVFFTSASDGIIVGSWGAMLETHSGGW